MAEVRPFSAVRFDPTRVGDLARVVTAPYDIIPPDAQREFHERSPYNAIRVEFGYETSRDSDQDNRYTRANLVYRDWLREGVLRADAVPGFYLYEETFDYEGATYARRSMLAPVRLANWDEKVVLPHEYTLAGPKIDRLQLLNATHTQFSPILAMYDDPGGVSSLLAKVAQSPPLVDFSLAPGEVAAAARQHRIWQIADPAAIASLRQAFSALQLFIADGHHRYETALAYRDERRALGAGPDSASEYVMMALAEMDDPGLLVLPTHRILRGLGKLNPKWRVDRLRPYFRVKREPHVLGGDVEAPAVKSRGSRGGASRPVEFILLGLEWGFRYRLTLRRDIDLAEAMPEVPEVLRPLDTVILQNLILEPVFGVTTHEVEEGERLRYTRDRAEAVEAVEAGSAQLAFLLNPIPLDLLRSAVRAGERMPQKTTYFYPKPVTGAVFFDHEAAWAGSFEGAAAGK